MQIDPPSCGGVISKNGNHNGSGVGGGQLMVSNAGGEDGSSDDANTPLQSPKSPNTSREEDDSSNANESDCKSPNQRWDICVFFVLNAILFKVGHTRSCTANILETCGVGTRVYGPL